MFYLFLVRNTVSVVKFTCVWLVECCFNHIFGVQFMLFCVAVGVCVKVTSCYLSNFYNVELPIQQVKLVTTSYYLIVEIHCLVQFSNSIRQVKLVITSYYLTVVEIRCLVS